MSTDASTSSTTQPTPPPMPPAKPAPKPTPSRVPPGAGAMGQAPPGQLVFPLAGLGWAQRWATVVVWLQYSAARSAPVTALTPAMRAAIAALAAAHPDGEFHREVLHANQHWRLDETSWEDTFFALTAPAPAQPLSGPLAWQALHVHPMSGATTRLGLAGPVGAAEPFGACIVNSGRRLLARNQPARSLDPNKKPDPPVTLPTSDNSLYLLDPRVGLLRFDARNSRAAFVAHMTASNLAVRPFRSFVVDDPPVRKPGEAHRPWLERARTRLRMADIAQGTFPLIFHEETFRGPMDGGLQPALFQHHSLFDHNSIWRFTSRPRFESVFIGADQTYDSIRDRIDAHSGGDRKVDAVRTLSFCRNPAALMGISRSLGGDPRVSHIIDNAEYLLRIDLAELAERDIGVTGHPALGRAISIFETEYVLVRTPGESPLPLSTLAVETFRNPFKLHQRRAIAEIDGTPLATAVPADTSGIGNKITRVGLLLKWAAESQVEVEAVDRPADIPAHVVQRIESDAAAIERLASPLGGVVRGEEFLRQDPVTTSLLQRIVDEYSRPLMLQLRRRA